MNGENSGSAPSPLKVLKAVVFDLDGTLSDSVGAICAALTETWTNLGRPPPSLSATREMIGDGPGVFIEKARAALGLPEDKAAIQAETTAFLDAYVNAGPGGTAYDRAAATLKACADMGLRLVVCTNKPQAPAEILLADLGFSPWLAGVVGGDAVPARKPDPAHVLAALALFDDEILPQQAVFIGDGPQDVAAGEAAGLAVIIAAYGYGGMAESRPDLPSIERIDALPDVLRTLDAQMSRAANVDKD